MAKEECISCRALIDISDDIVECEACGAVMSVAGWRPFQLRNGHSQDTIVAVTFVKLVPHNYELIIMAAGTNASGLRDKVSNKLKNVHFL